MSAPPLKVTGTPSFVGKAKAHGSGLEEEYIVRILTFKPCYLDWLFTQWVWIFQLASLDNFAAVRRPHRIAKAAPLTQGQACHFL